MSKYTTELRYICESLAGEVESKGYNSINEIISKSRDKIFSFDYPLFDPEYKPTLEEKIIKHYYTREICAETYGRWKLFLESRLLEIMPYYNQLYNSTLLEYDIFDDVNYLRSGERENNEDGINNNVTSNNGESWQYFSDTPQGGINDLDETTYLTNATKDTVNNSGTNDTTHEKHDIETYSELIKGKMPGKSYMNMIQEFRDIILNIDKMVIDELADLFMMIY